VEPNAFIIGTSRSGSVALRSLAGSADKGWTEYYTYESISFDLARVYTTTATIAADSTVPSDE
jgi:hypothetical protein